MRRSIYKMIENQIGRLPRARCLQSRQQFLEELRCEERLREAQALEFLRVYQPAGAIVLEDKLVFREDLLAQDVLRIGETVADHLEHNVKGGQREAHHDQTALAPEHVRSGHWRAPDGA